MKKIIIGIMAMTLTLTTNVHAQGVQNKVAEKEIL